DACSSGDSTRAGGGRPSFGARRVRACEHQEARRVAEGGLCCVCGWGPPTSRLRLLERPLRWQGAPQERRPFIGMWNAAAGEVHAKRGAAGTAGGFAHGAVSTCFSSRFAQL